MKVTSRSLEAPKNAYYFLEFRSSNCS